jgi:FkbH-like protein
MSVCIGDSGVPAPSPVSPPRVAVAATFTAEPLAEPLRLWLADLRCPADVVFAPHNQVTQQLLDPAGLLTDRPGLNAILLRLEDWAAGAGVDLPRSIDEFGRALESAARRSRTPYVLLVCPSSRAFDGRTTFSTEQARVRLQQQLQDVPGVHVLAGPDIPGAEMAESIEAWSDGHGQVPYAPLFFNEMATSLARAFHALHARPAKVLVLDADHTLWDGECATDDPASLRIDSSHRALHAFALRQRAEGVLLCLCSKNVEDDVLRALERHPDSLLRREHFAAWRINWRAKSDNLRSLGAELGLGTDSFVVFDDSELECAEMQAGCPGAIVLTWPRDPDCSLPFLQRVWPLDRLRVTDTDRDRPRSFAAEQERRRLRDDAPSLAEFVQSLQVKVTIAPLAVSHVARAAQLTERTNQFNTSGLRKTEAEVGALSETPDASCFVVEVSDRLGEYGIVGAVFAQLVDGALRIDTLVLSCRALGRGVEHQIIAHVGRLATERGLESIECAVTRTGRNQPALDFFARIAARVGSEGTRPLFRLGARAAAMLRFEDDESVRTRGTTRAEPVREAAGDNTATSWPLPALDSRLANEIANGLQSARQRLRRASAVGVRSRGLGTAAVPPRTPLETILAEAWARHARVSVAGIDDDFFELGGSSLQATMLVNEIQRRAGRSFAGVVVFQCPTVSSLVQYLELREPGAARALVRADEPHPSRTASWRAPDDDADDGPSGLLLENLDGLSDEEVEGLLAALDSETGEEGSR